jgi:hypothetical protein
MPHPLETSETIRPLGRATSEDSGVEHRDGVFYARLPVCGQDLPIFVALHGIRTELEAATALELLLRRRPCVGL